MGAAVSFRTTGAAGSDAARAAAMDAILRERYEGVEVSKCSHGSEEGNNNDEKRDPAQADGVNFFNFPVWHLDAFVVRVFL